MKIRLYKTRSYSVSRDRITLDAECARGDLKLDDVDPTRQCYLHIGDQQLSCTIGRLSKISSKKPDSYGISLLFKHSVRNLGIIDDNRNMDNVAFTLVLQEKADAATLKEAQELLHALTEKTGREESDWLYELSSFKGVPGKRNIQHISSTQLPIIVDKAKKCLTEHAE